MKKSMAVASCALLSLAFVNCVDTTGDGGEAVQAEERGVVQTHAEIMESTPRRESPVFIKSGEVDLRKGESIPKETFILKADETEDSYVQSSSGPWNFSGLAKTAATGTRTATGWFQRIHVISGTSSSIGCPSGTKLDLDMNRGAGGRYVYLCGVGGYSNNIKPSSIYTIAKSSSAPPASEDVGFKGVGSSNSDLNQGAGGSYVYGRYSVHTGSCGIDGIGGVFRDHWWESTPLTPSGWRDLRLTYDADLNDGAGGAFIFFIFRTVNNCWQ